MLQVIAHLLHEAQDRAEEVRSAGGRRRRKRPRALTSSDIQQVCHFKCQALPHPVSLSVAVVL